MNRTVAFTHVPGMAIPVEVRPTMAPDGRVMVLLQFTSGFILLPPDSARELAQLLATVADDMGD